MNFEEEKYLEVINCDYARLRRRKQRIDEENKEKAKNNKNVKSKKLSKTLFAVSVLTITFVALGLVLWFGLLSGFGKESVSEFRWNLLELFGQTANKTKEVFASIWLVTPYVIESLYAVLALLVVVIIVKKNNLSAAVQLEKEQEVPDSLLFAEASEGRKIGSLEVSEYQMTPFVAQKVAVSCELADAEEKEVVKYTSLQRWDLVLVPGLFRKYIDVENMLLLVPYINKDEKILSAEDAIVHERLLRRNAEMLVEAQAKTAEKELRDAKKQLEVFRNEARVLEDKLIVTQQEAKENVEYRSRCAVAEKSINGVKEELEATKKSLEVKSLEYDAYVSEKESEISSLKESTAKEIATVKKDAADDIERTKQAADASVATARAESDSKVAGAEAKAEEANKKFVALSEREAATRAKLEAAEAECSRKIEEATASLKENIDIIKRNAMEEIAKLKTAITEKDGKISFYEKERAEKEKTVEQMLHNDKVALERYSKIEQEYELNKNALGEAQKKLAEYEAVISENGRASDAIALMRKKLEASEQASEVLKNQKNALVEQLDAKNKELSELREANADVAALKNSRDTLAERVDALSSELAEAKLDVEKYKKAEKDCADACKKRDSLAEKVNSLTSELTDKSKRLEEVERAAQNAVSNQEQLRKIRGEVLDLQAEKQKCVNELVVLQKKTVEQKNYITALESKLRNASVALETTLSQREKEKLAEIENAQKYREEQERSFAETRKIRAEALLKHKAEARAAAEEANKEPKNAAKSTKPGATEDGIELVDITADETPSPKKKK